MKILKKLLKLFLSLLLILSITLLVILKVESNSSRYLSINEASDANRNSYIIANAKILTMESDSLLLDKYVLIENGFIRDICDSIKEISYPIIDAQGKYLMPGLIDMHVHVWDKQELGLYLANGITAIRNLWGMPMHLRMKEDINAGKIMGPSLFTSGPKLTGPDFIGDDNLNIYSPEEARAKVIEYKSRGYDFIKSYYGITGDIFAALLDQAVLSDIDVVSHSSPKVPFNYHFHPQIRSIEHAEDIVQNALNYQLDSANLKKLIEKYSLINHSSFSPTLSSFYNIYRLCSDSTALESDQANYMNPLIKLSDSRQQFERWQSASLKNPHKAADILRQHRFHLFALKLMHEAGVNIVCSTDAGIGITAAGFSIHEELAFYKELGMSNFQVLETATINASQVHAQMANLGTISKGKVANMLLLDANPLANLETLKEPASVFCRGMKLEKDQLKQFKRKAFERSNLFSTIYSYAEYLWIEK
tara:strand:+ start:352 stop:1785 length:1434 start_codon:yes stop_codon:yes gene_type:complete